MEMPELATATIRRCIPTRRHVCLNSFTFSNAENPAFVTSTPSRRRICRRDFHVRLQHDIFKPLLYQTNIRSSTCYDMMHSANVINMARIAGSTNTSLIILANVMKRAAGAWISFQTLGIKGCIRVSQPWPSQITSPPRPLPYLSSSILDIKTAPRASQYPRLSSSGRLQDTVKVGRLSRNG